MRFENLAAYALGFGATGLTFFDEEVTDFFSPHVDRVHSLDPVCIHYSSARSSSVPPGVSAMETADAREPDDLGSARRLRF